MNLKEMEKMETEERKNLLEFKEFELYKQEKIIKSLKQEIEILKGEDKFGKNTNIIDWKNVSMLGLSKTKQDFIHMMKRKAGISAYDIEIELENEIRKRNRKEIYDDILNGKEI